MLTVTESALERLSGEISTTKESKPANACFRLVVDGDGELALAIDVPQSEDRTFEHEGVTVLVLSEQLSEQNQRRTLDMNAAGDFVLI